jgi:hypothetical protein
MNEEQQEKLKKLDSFLKKTELSNNLPLFEVLQDINETLKVLAKKEMPEIPPLEIPDTHRVVIEGVEVLSIKGDKGDRGDTPQKGVDYYTPEEVEEIRGEVTPRKGVDYRDGKDGEDGAPGETPRIDYDTIIRESTKKTEEALRPLVPKSEDIKNDIIKSGETIRDSLESLEGERKLDKSAIKGLGEELSNLETRIQRIPSRSGGARKITYVKRHNLSSQVDGATKTFSLPKDTIEVLGVWGTQFPINFNPGTDWTFSGNTLTLTDEVSAPEEGQTLHCLIETLFYG